VGFGKIPRQVAAKAQSFGLEVIASDPYVPDEVFAGAGVRSVTFEELLAGSDYVSIHAPLTPETEKMFNADAFAKMRRGAYVVNTARGPLIDADALADALDSGQIGGAGLDVLPTEPPPADSRLLGRPNVILTPHTGFYSEESMIDLQAKAAEQVVLVLSGKDPQYPVNLQMLEG
jgi:D-3-phosphoglycerate dehydrogenase